MLINMLRQMLGNNAEKVNNKNAKVNAPKKLLRGTLKSMLS
jgi:hypothetical protein